MRSRREESGEADRDLRVTSVDPIPGSISIVLPIRNEERYIEECLETVRNQDYDAGPVEILVSDGLSTDRTREIVARVAERDHRVRLIDNPGGIVPTAMNAAIERARGEFIVRVDGHSTIPSDYVRCVVDAFQSSGAECVGGRMVASGESYWGRVIARATSNRFGVGGARFHYSEDAGPADTVYLGAYRRRTLAQLGGYDERFVRNQDDELNYRLRKQGGVVWFEPSIRANYVNRGSIPKLFSQYRQYGYWKVWMYRKHFRLFNMRHAIPAIFVLALAVGFAGVLFSPVWGALAVVLLMLHVTSGFVSAVVDRWPIRYSIAAPTVFLVLHTAYGWGTIQGLASAVLRGGVIPGGELGTGNDPAESP